MELKYGQFKSKGPYLNDGQKIVYNFIKENEPVKVGDISKQLNQISINTIKNAETTAQKDIALIKFFHSVLYSLNISIGYL